MREASDADAPDISRIGVAGWQTAYVGLVPQDFLDALDVGQRADVWRDIIASAPHPPLVAELDGTVVGFAASGPTRDDDADPETTAEVYAIYVDPARWRTGIGGVLLDASIDRLRTHFPRCTLWALEGNERAHRFYAAHGFTPDGVRKQQDSRGVLLNEVRYACDLRTDP